MKVEPHLLASGCWYLGLVGCFVSSEDASSADEIEKAAITALQSEGRPGASLALAPTRRMKKIGCRLISEMDVAAPATMIWDEALLVGIRRHQVWEASRRCYLRQRVQTRIGPQSPMGGAARLR